MKSLQQALLILILINYCQSYCLTDDCSVAKPRCIESEACVECKSNSDCEFKFNKYCGSYNECVQCDPLTSAGCNWGQTCNSGYCTCATDQDCEEVNMNNPSCTFICFLGVCKCTGLSYCQPGYKVWANDLSGCDQCMTDNDCDDPNSYCDTSIYPPQCATSGNLGRSILKIMRTVPAIMCHLLKWRLMRYLYSLHV